MAENLRSLVRGRHSWITCAWPTIIGSRRGGGRRQKMVKERALNFSLYGRPQPARMACSTAVPGGLLTRKRSQVQTLSRPPSIDAGQSVVGVPSAALLSFPEAPGATLRPRPGRRGSLTTRLVGGVGSAGAGGVALHRGRVAGPGRACGRVAEQGSRVVVVGRLQQWTWTAEDGSARSVVEVVAEELGPEPAVGDGHAEPDDQVELSRAAWLAGTAVLRRAGSR
jgi:Single-strand binding protein family